MKKNTGSYPRVRVEGGGRGAVSQAGAVLLMETVCKSGLDTAISATLSSRCKARSVHDPEEDLRPPHPLMGFVDHDHDHDHDHGGSGSGSGEPVAGSLRPGNAGSNTAAYYITAPNWPWPSFRRGSGAGAAR